MARQPPTSHWPQLLAHMALGVLVVATLLAVGQPIFTDDTWIHLALGRAYLEHGPWLASDPLLADAVGPPLPAAWLTGSLFHVIEHLAGFTGLRIFHVLMAASILILAWFLLRRASDSPAIASLGTGLFLALSAYRLVQLRPHLFSMLATLLMFQLLFRPALTVPSRRQIALCVLLFTVWANLHASFLLGPLLLGAGLAGIGVGALLGDPEARQQALERARPLGLMLLLGTLATLLNPTGAEQHLAYLIAGTETPSLARVADEWTRFSPFAWPPEQLPPSPLVWAVMWALLVATPVLGLRAVRTATSNPGALQRGKNVDPALLGIAAASLLASLLAVRFIWLGFFPILLIAYQFRRSGQSEPIESRSRSWIAAATSLVLLPTYFVFGPWPMISGLLPFDRFSYAAPYQTFKYNANAVWMFSDAELEGKLFADYYAGGFMGYWLAPDIQIFVNGTLNVPLDVINANRPIRERRGELPNESFTELLDRHEIDFFFGTRLPRVSVSNRPWYSTTAHLENTPGWIPIYRNLAGAVYMRDLPRNQENLRRVAEHYRRAGVPFDPEVGFDPMRVIARNRDWAKAHALIPIYFDQILASSRELDPIRRDAGMELLALLYTALGSRDEAIRLDRRLIRLQHDPEAPRRRLIYNLLRQGSLEEAVEMAQPILQDPTATALSKNLAELAGALARGESEDGALERSPLFSPFEAHSIAQGVLAPSTGERSDSTIKH